MLIVNIKNAGHLNILSKSSVMRLEPSAQNENQHTNFFIEEGRNGLFKQKTRSVTIYSSIHNIVIIQP